MSETDSLHIRPTEPRDHLALDAIRAAAFAPIFASFRTILGHEIYEIAQRRDDEAHGALLQSLLDPASPWEVYTAERGGKVVGFVSLRIDETTLVGELGLNAVHPDEAGRGIGAAMYEFALRRLREAGMRVATVGTAGDPSHAPARRAYEKVGFDVALPTVWLYKRL